MPDFWRSSGYGLLAFTPAGRLAVSDDFLRSFLLRPELSPLPEGPPTFYARYGDWVGWAAVVALAACLLRLALPARRASAVSSAAA